MKELITWKYCNCNLQVCFYFCTHMINDCVRIRRSAREFSLQFILLISHWRGKELKKKKRSRTSNKLLRKNSLNKHNNTAVMKGQERNSFQGKWLLFLLNCYCQYFLNKRLTVYLQSNLSWQKYDIALTQNVNLGEEGVSIPKYNLLLGHVFEFVVW